MLPGTLLLGLECSHDAFSPEVLHHVFDFSVFICRMVIVSVTPDEYATSQPGCIGSGYGRGVVWVASAVEHSLCYFSHALSFVVMQMVFFWVR